MLTLFAIPKPFRNHIRIIQRNAILSWTKLTLSPQILIFGNDEGTAEMAKEFGIRHIPDVARNAFGTPLVSDLFDKAQRLSDSPVLAYVNADIILTDDFITAIQQVRFKRFLMVGQRLDLEVKAPIDFSDDSWREKLHALARLQGRWHEPTGIDYFVFSKDLYESLPPFAIGRIAYDNWLIYKARTLGAAVIDASSRVIPVHQNHDYSHYPGGEQAVWTGEEAKENLRLAGGYEHVFTISDATHQLTKDGIRKKSKWSKERANRELTIWSIMHPNQRRWTSMAQRLLHLIIPA